MRTKVYHEILFSISGHFCRSKIFRSMTFLENGKVVDRVTENNEEMMMESWKRATSMSLEQKNIMFSLLEVTDEMPEGCHCFSRQSSRIIGSVTNGEWQYHTL